MKKVKLVLVFILVTLLATSAVLAYNGYEEYELEPTVTIFHTNDVHGRFLPSGTAIGIDTVAAIYAETPNSILVDAGDTFHGLPFATLNRGMDIIELMNAAGYSIFTPGNHDFNFGTDRLLELEEAAYFCFISANVLASDGNLLFEDIAIREINGVTIGFFGLGHPDTYHLTNPSNIVGISFADPIESARIAVEVLEEMGVDLIVALAHLGSGARSDYRVDGWAIAVAEAVDGIDLIIDGHSHNLHDGGLIVNNTLIAQAGDHGRNLGRVDIFVVDGEITMAAGYISRDYALENFEPDAEVQALIEEILAYQAEVMDIVVAYLPCTLYVDNIRSEEMPLGNLVADALRWAAGTDLAFTNGGGIRDVLAAGDVTKGDIISVLPFGNYLVVLEVTPAILAAAMENGVSALPGGGRFPQVSGFSFTYAPDLEEGYRVQSISVNGVELDLNDNSTIFTLATNNFIAAGGDAYTMFADLEILMELGNQDEIVIEFINYADLACLEVEGRIVAVYVPVVAPVVDLDEYVVEIEEYEYGYDAYEYDDEAEYYIITVEDADTDTHIIVIAEDDCCDEDDEYEPAYIPAPAPAVTPTARVNPPTGDYTAGVSLLSIVVMAGSAVMFGVAALAKRRRK